MNLSRSITITVDIRCPYDQANKYLSDPANFPAWASGLASGLHPTADGDWLADSPTGQVRVRFTPPNAFGVIDHHVAINPQTTIYIPMRVLPNGDGCHVSLTLFRQPDMTDERFAADADWVRKDLDALKKLLESMK